MLPLLNSLRSRLILLVLLAVIPALVFIIHANLRHRRHALENAQNYALTLAKTIGNLQDNVMEEGRTLVTTLAQIPRVKERDAAACNAIFANLRATSKRFIAFNAVGLDGVPFAGAPPFTEPVTFADRPYFQRLLKTQEVVVSEYIMARRIHKPILVFGAPVFEHPGKVSSAILASLDLNWLNRFVAQAKLPAGVHVVLFDRHGTVLAHHPDPEGLVGRPLPEAPLTRAILASKEGVLEVPGLEGVEGITGFTTLSPQLGGVGIAVTIPREIVYAEARRELLINLAALFLVASLALGVAWVGGDILVCRPVHGLLRVTRQLREGDLSARSGLTYGQGEIGQLARAFDEAGEALQRSEAQDREAVETLRQSEERYRVLVGNIPGVVFKGYADWSVDFFDDKVEEVTGYPLEEFASRRLKWNDLVPEEYLEDIKSTLLQALKTTGSYRREYPIKSKGGEVVWIRERGRIIFDEDGRIDYISGVFFDITAQKQGEAVLKEQARTLDAFFEHSLNPLVILDRDFNFIRVNQAYARACAREAADFPGHNHFEFYPHEENEAIFAKVVRTKEPFQAVAKPFVFPDHPEWGVTYWDWTLTPLLDSQGEVQSLVFSLNNVTEPKRAEEALRKSEARFIEAQRIALLGNWELNFLTDALLFSDEVYRIFGWSPQEFDHTFDATLAAVHPEDREAVREAINRARDERQPFNIDYRLIKPDGTERVVRAQGKVSFDEAGRPIRMAGTVQDITQQKLIEHGLRAAEERFRLTIERNADSIIIIDGQGTILYGNPAATALFARETERLTGAHFGFPIVTGETTEIEILRGDGSVAIGAMRVAETTWDGQLAYLASIRDVTEIKRAEAELKDSEQRFKSIFENAADGFLLADVETKKFILGNQKILEMLGYGPDELSQLGVADIHPPENRLYSLEQFDKLARGELSLTPTLPVLRKDGSVFYVEINAFPLTLKGKTYLLGIFRDVTERRELEAQFLQAQKMEAVGRLAGGVAHDFNNLLGVIMGYSEIMMMEFAADHPLYSRCQEIKQAAHRAASLTRQLLAFSRKQILQPKVIDLNDVIKNLEKMLPRLLGEDIEMATLLHPALESVKVDPSQMEQVIMNLAVNARDAMPLGGRLTIETANVHLDEGYRQRHTYTLPGPYVMLAVSDNGAGMDQETKARIFEPFFTTKAEGKGTGLGLSTIYGIIKQSNGFIEVYSEPGQGTTFKINLPQVREAVEQLKTEAAPAMEGGSETILIVEDDKMLRQLACEILSKQGYAVLEAPQGDEALTLGEQHEGPIHLLLTDVVMPQMNGRELAESLSALRPELKVIYMSGYTEDAIVQHGVLDPTLDFIPKPFGPLELGRKVREVLDRR